MDNGWVKLHRKLESSLVFQNEKCLKVWIWCLIRANHKPSIVLFGRSKINISKGEFIMGSHTAKDTLNMAISTIWYWLRFLESEGMVEIKNTNKYSLIKLKKWEIYQAIENKSETNQQANGKQMETDKNDKNDKNDKEEEKSVPDKPERHMSYLLNIPKEDIEEFKSKYEVYDQSIKGKAEELYNYCKAKGKTYKDYKAFLSNALKKDFGLKKVVVQPVVQVEITEEERLRNMKKLAEMKKNLFKKP